VLYPIASSNIEIPQRYRSEVLGIITDASYDTLHRHLGYQPLKKLSRNSAKDIATDYKYIQIILAPPCQPCESSRRNSEKTREEEIYKLIFHTFISNVSLNVPWMVIYRDKYCTLKKKRLPVMIMCVH